MSIERIYESLNQLAGAVDFLEQEVARKEAEKKATPAPEKATARQHDLFNEWAGNSRAANGNTAAALAKKLDNAIENVQWLLKQAEA